MSKIVKLTVEGSRFFNNPLEINFDARLNCIMGGRGTGKTTILWLINAALSKEIESNKEIYSLLNSNLKDGKIKLIVEDINGQRYEVQRTLGEAPLVYSNGQLVDFERFLLSVHLDFYQASSIEQIGQSPIDRLALIDKHLSNKILDIRKGEVSIRSQLSQNRSKLTDLITRIRDHRKKLEPLEGIEGELKEHDRNKPDVDEKQLKEFNSEVEKQRQREFERNFCDRAMDKYSAIQNRFRQTREELVGLVKEFDEFATPLNAQEVEAFRQPLSALLKEIEDQLGKQISLLGESGETAKGEVKRLLEKHKAQDTAFTQLKQAFDKNREYFQRQNQLNKQITAKNILTKELTSLNADYDIAVNQREDLLKQIKQNDKRIYELRLQKVTDINDELNGAVRITLKEAGITQDYEQLLKGNLKGCGFQYREASESIVERIDPKALSLLVLRGEYKKLSTLANIQEEKAKQVTEVLLDSSAIFELEDVYCPELPTFYLKVERKEEPENQERDNYRSTENLSTGQRCTAILPIIFAASKNPLIIDQPEDNLDNKYIADSIHRIIKSKKEFRQIIFVTHNPNIPVLSESEFNLFLDYRGQRSKIDATGNVEAVKANILGLLEGGEEAFNRRRQIYGY